MTHPAYPDPLITDQTRDLVPRAPRLAVSFWTMAVLAAVDGALPGGTPLGRRDYMVAADCMALALYEVGGG